MAKITYEQAYADHAYLWAIAPAEDMTGGYVDQDDLKRLLRSPTKATARDCLCGQIDYWFQKGPDLSRRDHTDWRTLLDEHPRLAVIAKRYGHGDDIDQDDE
ncbi:MAG TPA: hypothetical protein VJ652_16485 [Noviherbaspirillum sp.]|nr:hypothetical protein [Noviherbaspirillum sp.]